MSDHEFEKKMQQKMDDLRLRPSDAVWAAVERDLRREKRRRRIVLWLPLMGILLTAGGYFIFTGTGKSGQETLAGKAPAEKSVAPHSTVMPSTSTATVPTSAPKTKTSAKAEVETKPSSSPVSASSKNNNNPTTQNSTQPVNRSLQKHIDAATPDKPVVRKNSNADKNRGNKVPKALFTQSPKQKPSAGNEQDSEPKSTSTDKNINDKKPLQKDGKDAKDVKNEKDKEDKGKTVIDSNIVVYNNESDAENETLDSAASVIANVIAGKDPLPNKKPVRKTTKRTTTKKPAYVSKWQWGLTANGGVANISEGNVFDVLRTVRVYDLTGAGSFYNGIPPVPAPEPSPILPGASFTVGGFVQKGLSKRFSFSAGLQYSYFSVNTRIGQKVDSSKAINYGNFNSQVTDNYYRADLMMEDYVYRYHLIELPVMISYRMFNIKKSPIVLDAGLSFSRLINTTALHFDGISRVYYENDDFFNKMQVSLNGGLNVGLLQKSKHPLSVGPYLRYFTTGLLKKEVTASGAEQHIWSFGLNAKMLLKK
jgi:hypothetical protein